MGWSSIGPRLLDLLRVSSPSRSRFPIRGSEEGYRMKSRRSFFVLAVVALAVTAPVAAQNEMPLTTGITG